MPKQLYVPAISREVEFYAKNTSKADAVRSGEIEVKPAVKDLTTSVCERAEGDVEALLLGIEKSIDSSVKGIVRIKWTNKDRANGWASEGQIYNSRGRKRRIMWAGVFLGHSDIPLRLIGWAQPRGGVEGAKKLARACSKIGGVCVANGKEYPPSWLGDRFVVWFDQPLTLKTSRDDLYKQIAICAKRFFTIARNN